MTILNISDDPEFNVGRERTDAVLYSSSPDVGTLESPLSCVPLILTLPHQLLLLRQETLQPPHFSQERLSNLRREFDIVVAVLSIVPSSSRGGGVPCRCIRCERQGLDTRRWRGGGRRQTRGRGRGRHGRPRRLDPRYSHRRSSPNDLVHATVTLIPLPHLLLERFEPLPRLPTDSLLPLLLPRSSLSSHSPTPYTARDVLFLGLIQLFDPSFQFGLLSQE